MADGKLSLTECLRVLQKDPNVFRVLVTGVPSTYSTAEDLVGFLYQLRKQLERLITKAVKDVTKVRITNTSARPYTSNPLHAVIVIEVTTNPMCLRRAVPIRAVP